MFRHLSIDFFETFYGDKHNWILHSDTSWNDLDLNSISQLYEKSKLLRSFSPKFLYRFGRKCCMLPQPLGLLKLMLNFFLITNIQERKLESKSHGKQNHLRQLCIKIISSYLWWHEVAQFFALRMKERLPRRSPSSISNMDHFGICSSCFAFTKMSYDYWLSSNTCGFFKQRTRYRHCWPLRTNSQKILCKIYSWTELVVECPSVHASDVQCLPVDFAVTWTGLDR